jgi:hypothetical protein
MPHTEPLVTLLAGLSAVAIPIATALTGWAVAAVFIAGFVTGLAQPRTRE